MQEPDDDLATFDTLVGSIYDAAEKPELWRDAVEGMRLALNSTHAVAILQPDTVGREGITIAISDRVHVMKDFITNQLPSRAPFPATTNSEVSIVSVMLTPEEWHSSAFYTDLCHAVGIEDILSIELRLEDRSVYRLRFSRIEGQPSFDAHDEALATRLVPHLRRAFRLDQRLARQAVAHRRYAEACNRLGIATFILDARGELLETNRIGTMLLDDGEHLYLSKGCLFARDDGDNRNLQEAICCARAPLSSQERTSDQHVLRLRTDMTSGLNVLVQRIDDADGIRAGRKRPSIILYVRDLEFKLLHAAHAMQELFDLTQAESALVVRLANGLSLPEAAQDMHIRHSTARTHLRAVFGKTGLSRQSSLVRHVLNSVTMLTDAPPRHHS